MKPNEIYGLIRQVVNRGFTTEGSFYMSTDLVEQKTGLVEQAKQLPAGCDFFKELTALYVPHAEAETEAFRRDWVAKYEKGEIKVRDIWSATDGTEYKADENGFNMTVPSCVADYRTTYENNVYSQAFPLCAMLPITDTHRKFIVICHARRLDTEAALIEMVDNFPEFLFLSQHVKLSEELVKGVRVEIPKPKENLFPLFTVWKSAFSYLRPTHSRWPNQKYGELWRDTRAAYAQGRILESSGTRELVIAGLAEAVEKAQDLVVSSTSEHFDKRSQALILLSAALHKILRDEK